MRNPSTRTTFLSRPDAGPWPGWMPRLAFAPRHTAPRGDTLVVVFLRGAADALNLLVPHGEDQYYALRPTLGIARPDQRSVDASARALDLDGFFGLHPALAPLLQPWRAGHLAVVAACGAPDESRSHFKAMALMERGVSDETGPGSGWLGRHLATLDTGNHSPLRAIGFGAVTPRSLAGEVPVAALQSILDFHLQAEAQLIAQFKAALTASYGSPSAERLREIGQETLAAVEVLQALDPDRYRTPVTYPTSDFGQALKQVAMLVKAEVGLEVAAVDLGGWDTHMVQGGATGLLAGLAADLASGLSAFYTDMVDRLGALTVVVISEFGRRVAENASLGTDHGHGGALWVLGGQIAGGRVHGRWPGLAPDQLIGPGDLAITTDYRDVLGEIVARRLNNPQLQAVFPGYSPQPIGIVRG